MGSVVPPHPTKAICFTLDAASLLISSSVFTLGTRAPTEREHSGIRQPPFLQLLPRGEKYLEFLINSTCLGVNAKMHGLSWSFSLFCGTEEGKKKTYIKLAITSSYTAKHKEVCFFLNVLSSVYV